MAPLTARQVVFRIAVIVSLAELSIMLVLGTIPHEASTNAEAVLDAVLLAALSTPAIYLWVIRPFVTARDEALVQVGRLALTDPLTHLANRRLISEHLRIAIAASVRHKEYGAVLVLDLDGLKAVNDIHGHKAGDAVLVGVAERLPSMIRAEDVVGRLGSACWDPAPWMRRPHFTRRMLRCTVPRPPGEAGRSCSRRLNRRREATPCLSASAR